MALALMVLTGNRATERATVALGFGGGAAILGLGTTMMYSNLLAAVSDYVDPSWRASAMGTYRFWRDSGYCIGALVSGAAADAIGIPSTVSAVVVGVCGVCALVQWVYVDSRASSAAWSSQAVARPRLPAAAVVGSSSV